MQHESALKNPPTGPQSQNLAGKMQRVVRLTLAEQVYQDLKELLLAGQVAPGERFTLRGLAAAIGTSAMPVREAVGRLAAEQALEVLPNRAVRVPLMTRARFMELRLIRISLEGLAAALAAERRDDADLKALTRFEREFAAECERRRPDPAVAIRANKELHFAVYRAARMPALLQIVEGLWLQIGPVINLDLRASPERLKEGEAHIHHARLVEAVRQRDGDGARAALTADIMSAGDFILARGVLPD